MYRMGIALIVINLMFCLKIQSQNNTQSIYYDSITFKQYINSDFESIIKTCKKAIDQNVYFPFLNYRLAIAYYETRNYAKAVKYYEKVYAENKNDSFLNKSLYTAYLMSGQNRSANVFANTLNEKEKNELNFSLPAINKINVAGGILYNDNKSNQREDTTNFKYFNQYQDMSFYSLLIGVNLSHNSILNVGYQLYSACFERHGYSNSHITDRLLQHQIVASYDIFTMNKVNIGIATGYYNIDKSIKFTSETGKKIHAISVSLFANKRFTYFIPEISTSYSNFNKNNQWQSKFMLTYYPFGNLNYYGSTAIAGVYNQKNIEKQIVVSQHIGLKLIKNTWIDLNCSFGNHLNYIDNRTFLVFDTYDPIYLIAGSSLSYYFSKITISASYQWQLKKGQALSINNRKSYNYNNHIINIAVLWNL